MQGYGYKQVSKVGLVRLLITLFKVLGKGEATGTNGDHYDFVRNKLLSLHL